MGIDYLLPKMEINGIFVSIVEKDEQKESEEDDGWSLKSEECNEGEYFEYCNKFEFDRKVRVFNFLMKNFLAADWLILISNFRLLFLPKKIHDVKSS